MLLPKVELRGDVEREALSLDVGQCENVGVEGVKEGGFEVTYPEILA